MPTVQGKKFSYSKKGKKAAKAYVKKMKLRAKVQGKKK